MTTKIIKLTFQRPVHFGKKRLSDGEATFAADTFFSGLYIEALAMGMDSEWLLSDLVISDSFPYIDETLYLPKPLIKIEAQANDETNRKVFKKLNHIPVAAYHEYLAGRITASQAKLWADQFELGDSLLSDKVSLMDIPAGGESRPYAVGTYHYKPNAGLYIIVEATDDVFDKLSRVMEFLQYSGLGGKRSAGYGRFTYELTTDDTIVELLAKKGRQAVLLSTAMATSDELRLALPESRYLLRKRTGFVQSKNYEETLVKKKDFYSFVPGSVFTVPFDGAIFDVGENGGHPVYRYAKAIWMGVS
ncbi:type III-A CRISPR-associated RAMP protein Csm4 [Enterococcus asini]|uniref:CRISPR system Cms protein Csm4 n=1 Tax=Enterococcus asini TaxID=57732 RepID=A0AAW8TRJ3_9ENTE|nr:type III-A CRISPR-associated RAMP protein Csm4 [Enterococcus asini]MDT2808916.1 type III-A CRISPR-associated RAMP protein Csm4 [Enterococcus asini]